MQENNNSESGGREKEPHLGAHNLPEGVIRAGIDRIEDEANQRQPDSEATISVDAITPVSIERGRLTRSKDKIKDIGRAALERLVLGGTVTWHGNVQDDNTNNE